MSWANLEYKAAAKGFEEVDRQHPYSVWATKAQIMAAFAYYSSNKYDEAIIALDRFIQLHPGHRDIPYAYYLKALCFYEQISDVGRDQRITQQALDALAEVVKRFPESPYARDARLKVELAIDHLAGKEMSVGRYYQANQHISAPSTATRGDRALPDHHPCSRSPAPAGRKLSLPWREERGAGGGGGARLQLPGQRMVSGQLLPDDRRGYEAADEKRGWFFGLF
jgi:outer membrane protein assembly factor BamD